MKTIDRQERKQTNRKRTRGGGKGVAQVQLRGVPHVQCPMWPPAQVTPTSDIPISWIFPSAAIHHPVRYSDCSSRYLFIPDILRLHICLHQISDGVLYRYWAEVKSEEWISDPSNLALSSLVCVCRATFFDIVKLTHLLKI